MAAKDDVVPVFVRVKNSVRVVAADPLNVEKGLIYVVEVILEEFGRVSKNEILAIQDYPRRGIYDVTFEGEGVFHSFVRILEENPADPRLSGFKVFPHFAEEEIFLVVKTYSPFVPLKEIETVLGRYCKKLTFGGKILNELGIWTSKYRFKAVLEKGMYPPARFRLGTVNIDCFFSGMPEFCRRCKQYGHLADGCVLCQNCGITGHEFKSCPLPRKCNFCFQGGHLYAACPKRKVKPKEVDVTVGKSLMQVEMAPIFHNEEEPTDQASQSEFKVKRAKEKKREEKKRKKEETGVSSSAESVDFGLIKTLSRGEKLYCFFKDKSYDELMEALDTWPDAEEQQDILKKCGIGRADREVKRVVLKYFRDLM
ncbi:zinc finger CCHC domain-containing protein 3-like [Xenopus tropicalis]|uniref:Zinc finger CCHC domain-containing protein 3-like n=1 Tax=Xenopus tropicalis TaxID=8364 RepID=A0A8J0SDF8_XENTR|nr:zinc finger CCHC domain-containing protein 3-like [Xenopus tropicalis]